MRHRARPLAEGGADAVGAGVAAAEHHHVPTPGQDFFVAGDGPAFVAAVLLRQVVHGELGPEQFPSGQGQVARGFAATSEGDGISLVQQPGHRYVDADVTGASLKLRVQAASHSAGQTRPVNSGKLLVACSASSASRHWPW